MPKPKREFEPKACRHCGKLLERKRYPSGRIEDAEQFARRVYCDRECMAAFMREQAAS